jgi:hypothetical protein
LKAGLGLSVEITARQRAGGMVGTAGDRLLVQFQQTSFESLTHPVVEKIGLNRLRLAAGFEKARRFLH